MNRKDLSLGIFLSCCSLPMSTCLAMRYPHQNPEQNVHQPTAGMGEPHQEENGSGLRAILEQAARRAIYSGNPENGNVHTYMFLCRNGADGTFPRLEQCERDCCTCDICKFCSSGLSVVFITTEGEFSDINGGSVDFLLSGGNALEEQINLTKIIWSGYSSFAPDPSAGKCCEACFGSRTPRYKFQYVYGENYLKPSSSSDSFESFPYGQYGEKKDQFTLDKEGDVNLKEPKRVVFLKLKTRPTHEKSMFFTGEIKQGKRPPLRVVRALRSALYRWEIAPSTITDVLTTIGRLGEGINHEVPQYNKLCWWGGYNCAKFARDTLKAFGINGIPDDGANWLVSGGSVIGGILIGKVGMKRSGFAGVCIGGIAGCASLVYNTLQNALPQATVNNILDNYKRLPPDQRGSFEIVVHNIPHPFSRPQQKTESEQEKERIYNMFNYRADYRAEANSIFNRNLRENFVYKEASSAVFCSITTTV